MPVTCVIFIWNAHMLFYFPQCLWSSCFFVFIDCCWPCHGFCWYKEVRKPIDITEHAKSSDEKHMGRGSSSFQQALWSKEHLWRIKGKQNLWRSEHVIILVSKSDNFHLGEEIHVKFPPLFFGLNYFCIGFKF